MGGTPRGGGCPAVGILPADGAALGWATKKTRPRIAAGPGRCVGRGTESTRRSRVNYLQPPQAGAAPQPRSQDGAAQLRLPRLRILAKQPVSLSFRPKPLNPQPLWPQAGAAQASPPQPLPQPPPFETSTCFSTQVATILQTLTVSVWQVGTHTVRVAWYGTDLHTLTVQVWATHSDTQRVLQTGTIVVTHSLTQRVTGHWVVTHSLTQVVTGHWIVLVTHS